MAVADGYGAVEGRLGPTELAPDLMERVTRVEAVLVEGFFPGEGTISTGRPRWDGGPRDRARLRRCFHGAAALVLLVAGFSGSLLLDLLVSWVASGFDTDGDLSGISLVGWAGWLAWFVRRLVQVRRWYRAGVGREAELSRQAVPRPASVEPTGLPPWLERTRTFTGAGGVLFILGTGLWLLHGALDARAHPDPDAGSWKILLVTSIYAIALGLLGIVMLVVVAIRARRRSAGEQDVTPK